MQKSRIEWTDYTWNPIKGICPVGCHYCYARRMYKRFGWNPEVRLANFIYGKHLKDGKGLTPPSGYPLKSAKIFVCSTFEIFHPIVKKEWRDAIFKIIENSPQHTFQILTKMPQSIDRPMPDNVWLGISLDGNESPEDFLKKESALYNAEAKLKFVSYEPLLHTPRPVNYDWVIVGRLTGYGNKHDPPRGWIELLVDIYSKKPRISIFLKDNLKEIWGEDLIQEFPK